MEVGHFRKKGSQVESNRPSDGLKLKRLKIMGKGVQSVVNSVKVSNLVRFTFKEKGKKIVYDQKWES